MNSEDSRKQIWKEIENEEEISEESLNEMRLIRRKSLKTSGNGERPIFS